MKEIDEIYNELVAILYPNGLWDGCIKYFNNNLCSSDCYEFVDLASDFVKNKENDGFKDSIKELRDFLSKIHFSLIGQLKVEPNELSKNIVNKLDELQRLLEKEKKMKSPQFVEPPKLSLMQAAFAKKVADLATEYNVDHLTISMKPIFNGEVDWRVHGDIVIHFSKTDGRGRPCRNLKVQMTTTSDFPLESNPESCN